MDQNPDPRSSLTETQRTLLRSAVQEGYFKIPRETTLLSLADSHDMSDREVSEEIRAGLDTLLRTHTFDSEST